MNEDIHWSYVEQQTHPMRFFKQIFLPTLTTTAHTHTHIATIKYGGDGADGDEITS